MRGQALGPDYLAVAAAMLGAVKTLTTPKSRSRETDLLATCRALGAFPPLSRPAAAF